MPRVSDTRTSCHDPLRIAGVARAASPTGARRRLVARVVVVRLGASRGTGVRLARAGLEVDLHVDGQLDDLAAGRALAAFRILQEALTNVLRHAPGARVSAILRRTAAELQIEIADDGGVGPGTRSEGGGQGLVGMRERAALYGGTLEAGPRSDRGFMVVARLPAGGG